MKTLAICQAAALTAIEHLKAANALDEELSTWDTQRLAAHAVQTLDMFESDGDDVGDEDLIDTLYDSLTLIRAAFSTRTDVISQARRRLLEKAYDAVNAAANQIEPARTDREPAPQPDLLDTSAGIGEREAAIREAMAAIAETESRKQALEIMEGMLKP